ncbi:unnamed protein product [Didymodactylos carnosus]|uniref:Reverse transcriptase RNase H-like domain-containing protein n=1 Tax=Didymodactylos carnosus TaxID=1234261 RepID=A0A815D7K3_9BILA|nr:unnamed protein product [Didymodactylos carnosus]CAF4103111.1 unnamed protein product [Didymodactylos carnosus]
MNGPATFQRIVNNTLGQLQWDCYTSFTFTIQADASNIGIGAVLLQLTQDGEKPVAYISKDLNKQQQNWSTTERECFAIVQAVKKWDSYISGQEFIITTDHHPLC